MLELDELSVQRRGFGVRVGGLNLASGGRVTVIGPSGSGKSTLLRSLIGLEAAARVRGLRWQGAELAHEPPHRRPFGWMPQDLGLWPHLRAVEHVAFVRSRGRRAAPSPQDHAVLEQLGLAHRADALPAFLSGGERQRLAFARIFASEPALAVLDEPFSHLDAVLAHSLGAAFRALAEARGISVVQVNHQVEHPQDDDLFWVLEDGRLTQTGRWLELKGNPCTPWIERFVALQH